MLPGKRPSISASKLLQVSKTAKQTEQKPELAKDFKIGVKLKAILDEIESGDCLPEAEIVCNIIEKLHLQLKLAACLSYYCSQNKDEVTNFHHRYHYLNTDHLFTCLGIVFRGVISANLPSDLFSEFC